MYYVFGFIFEIVLLVCITVFLCHFCVYLSLLAFIHWYIWLMTELQRYCSSIETLFSRGGPYCAGEVFGPPFCGGVHFFEGGPNIQAQVEVFVPGVHTLRRIVPG